MNLMCVACVRLNWATMGRIKNDQGSILLPLVHQSSLVFLSMVYYFVTVWN
jgi:hypothetical protein